MDTCRRPPLCSKRLCRAGRSPAHRRQNNQRSDPHRRRFLRTSRTGFTPAAGNAGHQRPDHGIPLRRLQSDELRNGECCRYGAVQPFGASCRNDLPDHRQPDDGGCFCRLPRLHGEINQIYLKSTDKIKRTEVVSTRELHNLLLFHSLKFS